MSADPDVAALPIPRVLPGAGPRTRQGLALLRELAGERRIGWDPADGVELARGSTRRAWWSARMGWCCSARARIC